MVYFSHKSHFFSNRLSFYHFWTATACERKRRARLRWAVSEGLSASFPRGVLPSSPLQAVCVQWNHVTTRLHTQAVTRSLKSRSPHKYQWVQGYFSSPSPFSIDPPKTFHSKSAKIKISHSLSRCCLLKCEIHEKLLYKCKVCGFSNESIFNIIL